MHPPITKTSQTLLVALLLSIFTTLLAAPLPIGYQGLLSDSGSTPLSGTYDIEFSIYSTSVGGTPIWTENFVDVDVVDGRFDLALGSTVAFPDSTFQLSELYIGISVDGGAEMSPRRPIYHAPRANSVTSVDGSAGGTIQGTVTVTDAINVGSGNVLSGLKPSVIGQSCSVTGTLAAIFGGNNNEVDGAYAYILGGESNDATANRSMVIGGQTNEASNTNSVIVGGASNDCSGLNSTILGGNNSDCSGTRSSILGGQQHECSGEHSSIVGGMQNTCGNSFSTVLNGDFNTNNGIRSVIIGGQSCEISGVVGVPAIYCMAFGQGVRVRGAQRLVCFYDGTNHGRFALNRDTDNGAISHPIHVGTNTANGNGARLTAGGVWTNASSRKFKENYTPLGQQQLFDAIESLNIEGWNYRNSDERHIGPYAEEFVEAFGVGTIDEQTGERVKTHLAAGDVAGVALAAVKELINKTRRIEELEERIAKIEKYINKDHLARR